MSSMGEIALNRKFIEMMKLLNTYLNHFPKHEKFALSQEIRVSAYRLYDLITETHKRYYKKTTITEMDVTHEQLRMKIYLANELGYFAFKDGQRKEAVMTSIIGRAKHSSSLPYFQKVLMQYDAFSILPKGALSCFSTIPISAK